MGCIRNHSRIWSSWVFTITAVACIALAKPADARFASQFSLTGGELFTDNVFFTKNKEHDFVTTITPSLHLFYAPEGQSVPTLNLNISPSAVIFARHSEFNNFGDNWGLNGGYTYQYSPRLNFQVSDVLGRQGEYRLGPITQGVFQLPSAPTSPPPTGGTLPGQSNQNLSNFTSGSQSIWNNFSVQGTYRYRPDVTFTGNYTNNFNKNIGQAGGSDVYNTISFRGVYNWRQEHNLHAGYSIGIYNSRNNGNNVVNNFDIGDDYFSNYEIRLSPTLTLAASTGLSFNAGSEGPRVANNSNVTITKIWETATASVGLRKGLTPSYGVSSLSDTTNVFGLFDMRLTEKLTLKYRTDFSLYDTDNGTVKTFQTSLGASYLITSWLDTNLLYAYRWVDSGSGVASNSDGLLQQGVVRANSVYLTLTAHFDLWPNTGLRRGLTFQGLSPMVRTPFPRAEPTSSPTANP